MRKLVAAALLVALAAAPAGAQRLDESGFRWMRPLDAPSPGLLSFEPDGALFARSKPELADLRVLDARGRQVPWRTNPFGESVQPPLPVLVLNSGVRNGAAVALLDLGPGHGIHDEVTLDIPESDFVGRVEVSGSDRRRGPFTALSTTGIYDISGAPSARSTTAVYPPSDFRYLSLRATGVSEISGAVVLGSPSRRIELLERAVRSVRVRAQDRSTVVTVDLGHRNVPVDEVRVVSSTELYDRPVQIEASNDGENYGLLAQGRVFRFAESAAATVPAGTRHRFVRLTIDNGDDAPLAGLRVEALARPRTVFLAGGFELPYRLLYGNPRLGPPEYDFAVGPFDPEPAAPARLGREARNPAWEPPEDTRSFTARHPVVLQATLALVAVVLFAGAFLALRRRAGTESGG